MPVYVYYIISGILGFIEGFLVNDKRPRGPYMWGEISSAIIIILPIIGWIVISILGAVFIAWWHLFLLLLTGFIVMKLSQFIFGQG